MEVEASMSLADELDCFRFPSDVARHFDRFIPPDCRQTFRDQGQSLQGNRSYHYNTGKLTIQCDVVYLLREVPVRGWRKRFHFVSIFDPKYTLEVFVL